MSKRVSFKLSLPFLFVFFFALVLTAKVSFAAHQTSSSISGPFVSDKSAAVADVIELNQRYLKNFSDITDTLWMIDSMLTGALYDLDRLKAGDLPKDPFLSILISDRAKSVRDLLLERERLEAKVVQVFTREGAPLSFLNRALALSELIAAQNMIIKNLSYFSGFNEIKDREPVLDDIAYFEGLSYFQHIRQVPNLPAGLRAPEDIVRAMQRAAAAADHLPSSIRESAKNVDNHVLTFREVERQRLWALIESTEEAARRFEKKMAGYPTLGDRFTDLRAYCERLL